MKYSHSKLLLLLMITFLAIQAEPVQANIIKAQQAYQQKNYQQAFDLYRQSAHLGKVDAQLKIAGFYASGIGVKADMVQSYLYLTLAGDHGNNVAKINLETIFNSLTAAEKSKIKALWPTMKAEYGVSALTAGILPQLKKGPFYYKSAKLLAISGKATSSRFSPRRSKMGSVIVEFDVGKDGRVRDIEIEQNYYMDHVGVANIIEKVAQAEYQAAKKMKGNKSALKSYHHRSVWAQREVSKSYVKKVVPRFYRHFKSLTKSAEAGENYAKYQLGMYALVYPALEIEKTNYVNYITESARAGVISAELEYAQLLLEGKRVKRNNPKAMQYLVSAAQSGLARAQYKLARQLLSGRVVQRDEKKAYFWLKQAANQQEPYAKYWLARLSLIAKDKTVRDAKLAQSLLQQVAEQQRHNPNWFYFSAIAQWQLDNNKEAKNLLAQGRTKAEDYQWNLTKFNRLAKKI
ncbi:SEL1-like repeat protein [Colwellia piezophila]|uniref:SEL1-like repeat protein n=1 Tax=Colwellia piezophila TaxID=211668 RepID=UPI00037244EB|nr:SEL1-like repeat protein [Colwellia piezophila]